MSRAKTAVSGNNEDRPSREPRRAGPRISRIRPFRQDASRVFVGAIIDRRKRKPRPRPSVISQRLRPVTGKTAGSNQRLVELFFFFLVKFVEVFVVIEVVFLVLVDVDVVDLVVEFFVDVFFVLFVEFLVVELFVSSSSSKSSSSRSSSSSNSSSSAFFLFFAGVSPEQRGRWSPTSHPTSRSAAVGSANRASDSRQSSIDSVLSPREFIGEFPLTNALRMADSLLG